VRRLRNFKDGINKVFHDLNEKGLECHKRMVWRLRNYKARVLLRTRRRQESRVRRLRNFMYGMNKVFHYLNKKGLQLWKRFVKLARKTKNKMMRRKRHTSIRPAAGPPPPPPPPQPLPPWRRPALPFRGWRAPFAHVPMVVHHRHDHHHHHHWGAARRPASRHGGKTSRP